MTLPDLIDDAINTVWHAYDVILREVWDPPPREPDPFSYRDSDHD